MNNRDAKAAKTKKNAHLWARHPDDWYVEERFAVRELFRHELFPGGVIWDPCCGRGHILAEALAAGYEAIGTDLRSRQPIPDAAAASFMQCALADLPAFALAASVVFNPPYLKGEGIELFVRTMMAREEVQKIAAFIPAKFVWGLGRAREFWTVTPAARVYAINPRPSCPPGPVLEAGEEPGGGFEDFAWAIWERDRSGQWEGGAPTGETSLRWIVGAR